MQALLMHADQPCAVIDPESSILLSVVNPNEMPVGVWNENQMVMNMLYRNWLKARAIPKGRPGMDKILAKLEKPLADAFLDFHGVSLTDSYWIKEKDSPLTWSDVNFHENGFYPVFGSIYAGNEEIPWLPSPDFVTDGVMEKFWMNVGNIPSLVKIDRRFGNTLTANEVFLSRLSESMDLKARPVSYQYGKIGDLPVCICPCFVQNSRTDFVSALQIAHGGTLSKGTAFFRQAFKEELEDMLFLDILVGNTDRHEKNYGLLKTNGGEVFAPIFDSGSCLAYNADASDEKRPEIRLKYPFMDISRQEAAKELSGNRQVPDEHLACKILQNTYEQFSVPEYHFDLARNVLLTGMEALREAGREVQIPVFHYDLWEEEEYEST